jgi:hypothetical protein
MANGDVPISMLFNVKAETAKEQSAERLFGERKRKRAWEIQTNEHQRYRITL